MGLFGKRKEREAGARPAAQGGIRDLSGAPAPGENLSSDLGPPSSGTMSPQAPPSPPPPASALSEDDMPASGAGAAAPPPPAPPASGAYPPPPPPPSMPLGTFEASPAPGDLAMSAPAPSIQAAGGLERLDSVEQRLSDMARRVDLLDKASDDIRNDISRIRDSIAQIEGDMRELTSLYDLISTQINPFIDTSTMEEKPAVAVDQGSIPDLDALFEPTPELAAERQPEMAEGEAGTAAAPAAATGAGLEAGAEEAAPSKKTPRLARIGADASCHLALMEWIRYLLERVNRVEIPSVLSFYQRIGWIGPEIKADMLEIIRGIGAVAGEPRAPAAQATGAATGSARDAAGDIVIAYGKEQARELKGPAKGAGATSAKAAPAGFSATWRLTTDDHIASLMYIEWIRSGGDLDRDKLEEIRREVSRLRSGLDGFFSL